MPDPTPTPAMRAAEAIARPVLDGNEQCDPGVWYYLGKRYPAREEADAARIRSVNAYAAIIDAALADERAAVARLVTAAKPVVTAIEHASSIYHGDPDTWNPDAHIEITVSAAEALALRAAVAKAGQPA